MNVANIPTKVKTISEMAEEKERYRAQAAAAAKEKINDPNHSV